LTGWLRWERRPSPRAVRHRGQLCTLGGTWCCSEGLGTPAGGHGQGCPEESGSAEAAASSHSDRPQPRGGCRICWGCWWPRAHWPQDGPRREGWGTSAPLPPAEGGSGPLPLPACHVGVSAGREQSMHSQPGSEPNANKSIARALETHFPVFYLGFHCLCTRVNGANSSSIDTG